MAARRGIAQQAGIASGTSAKTLVQLIAATGQTIQLIEVGVGFHGTNNTHEPVLVQLVRQSTDGSMTALTPVKADDGIGNALTTTARHTATVEPTATDVIRSWTVHPQTGFVYQAHDLAPIIAASGGRIGLKVTAANNVNVDVYMCFVE
jgi:hypothetical protein